MMPLQLGAFRSQGEEEEKKKKAKKKFHAINLNIKQHRMCASLLFGYFESHTLQRSASEFQDLHSVTPNTSNLMWSCGRIAKVKGD